MYDYRALFELAARYLAVALYLDEAVMLRRLAAAPIFGRGDCAVEIIARYSAVLEEALEDEESAVDVNAIRAAALAELRGETPESSDGL